MPTYGYHCAQCGGFEAFQRITDSPLEKCASCGGGPVKRLIGPGAGFIFRGSGFHATDYRSAEYQRRAEAEGR